VVYGEYDKDFNPYPITERGLSYLNNEEWTNFPYKSIETPELADVAVNPNNPNEVYVSSYFDGLLRFENGELAEKYTAFNSNLEATPENTSTNADTRIGGLAFDRQGNLYLANSLVEHPLKRLSSGQIQNVDVSEGFPDPYVGGVGELVIGPSGNVFMGTMKSGIIAYQPSTGISKGIISSLPGVDFPDGYNPNPVISAMAFDQNNQLWIGTDDGIRVAYGPAGIFQNPPNIAVEPIIFLEGDVAQELLFEQYITDIAVDGKNNKWIATTDVGVFYISPNGQETIYHFTTENSPLPTNSVNSIEIDEVSGKVYFGTTRGLVAFRGVAVQAEESLAGVYVYPNPVRPGYTGLVTIAKLTQNANVKITDIEGNLVYETTSDGGNVQWDTRAFGKHKVASGVYLVLITSEDQLDTKVSKIMIIR
jgi:ligand-binding sensor domain-containing protein